MCHDDPAPGTGFRCDECPSGFVGDGQVCSDVDDCIGNPCTEHGVCTDVGANAYSCECGDGYVFSNGVNCTEVFNCDSVEANDCDSNAACNHDGPGRHSCSCN